MDKIYHNKNMTNSRESSFKTQSQIHGSTRPLHNPQSTEERSAREKKKTNNKNTKKTKIESDRYQASGTENGRFEGEGGVI